MDSVEVLGLGAVGIDYIANVKHYPKADEKIRTTSHAITGGGNCANTLTAMSRLGIKTSLISKWGNDGYGAVVASEMVDDKIDLSHSMISSSESTAFTYIIVDEHDKSRTCIHTPIKDITVEEINDRIVLSMNDTVPRPKLLHLDSRHTEAAQILAAVAKENGIKISIDCEKDRPPYFEQLLPYCDYIFTNQQFCGVYLKSKVDGSENGYIDKVSSEINADVFDRYLPSISSMISLYEHITHQQSSQPHAEIYTRPRFIVSTMGSAGAIMISPYSSTKENYDRMNFHDTEKWQLLKERLQQCPLRIEKAIVTRRQVTSSDLMTMNLIWVSAWPLQVDEIVDTTGAGDAFIGGCLSAMVSGFEYEDMLKLGTTVAAEKLKKSGPRSGLPHLENLII